MANEKPDLDLIAMVQRTRMQHDSAARPSQVSGSYWIEAKDQSGHAPAPTARSGEWCLETDEGHVDAVWDVIRAATEAGLLGHKSKVATAARGQNRAARMICVRTADADDSDDVQRVAEGLRALGMQGPMTYRRDVSES